ncbi:hypothetical protein PAC01_14150 [Pediococcus acidilactici]|nr:hypothetical protein PAC01_14150 [Pediococcus acidilactici]
MRPNWLFFIKNPPQWFMVHIIRLTDKTANLGSLQALKSQKVYLMLIFYKNNAKKYPFYS